PAASAGGGTSPTPERDLAPATGLAGRIVYSSVAGDLWVMAADGYDTTRCAPAGSDPSNIFVVNADGSGERQLTPARGAAAGGLFPAWSPDGRWIAYSNGAGINLV